MRRHSICLSKDARTSRYCSRRDPGTGQTASEHRLGSRGPGKRQALRALPSRAQPRPVVEPGGEPGAFEAARKDVLGRHRTVGHIGLDETLEMRWGAKIA